MPSIVEMMVLGEQSRMRQEGAAIDNANRTMQMEEILRARAERRQRTTPGYAMHLNMILDPKSSLEEIGPHLSAMAPADLEWVTQARAANLRYSEGLDAKIMAKEDINNVLLTLDPKARPVTQDMPTPLATSLLGNLGSDLRNQRTVNASMSNNANTVAGAGERLDTNIQARKDAARARVEAEENKQWKKNEAAIMKDIRSRLSEKVFGMSSQKMDQSVDFGEKKSPGQQYLSRDLKGIKKADMIRAVEDAVDGAAELYHSGYDPQAIVDILAGELDLQKGKTRWGPLPDDKATLTVKPGNRTAVSPSKRNPAEEQARAMIRQAAAAGNEEISGDDIAEATGLSQLEIERIVREESEAGAKP